MSLHCSESNEIYTLEENTDVGLFSTANASTTREYFSSLLFAIAFDNRRRISAYTPLIRAFVHPAVPLRPFLFETFQVCSSTPVVRVWFHFPVPMDFTVFL